MGATTAEVFSPGIAVHLRVRFGGLERMVPATCQGVGPADDELVLVWSEEAAAQANPPRKGQELQCYTLVDGVLYMVDAQVTGLTDDSPPRINCAVSSTCHATPLRRHQRFQVQGELSIGEPDDENYYCHNQPQPMDLSLGGFGSELPAGDWQVGDEAICHLKVWVDIHGRAAVEHPVLQLNGRAAIRNVRPDENGGMVFVGLEFVGLPELQAASLHLWLVAHASFMRSA